MTRPTPTAKLQMLLLALALCATACQTPPSNSDSITQLTNELNSILDSHDNPADPNNCQALGKALHDKATTIDRSLAVQLRRLSTTAHRLDEPTRQTLESFSRKFAAASLRCKDAVAFKDALSALEAQLDER